jgi:hypothetical protein
MSYIGRTSIGSNPSIQDKIIEAILWLEGLTYWPWKIKRDASTITLASSTWNYSLPGDFHSDLAFRITQDNKEDDLERLAFEDFIRKHPDPSANDAGQPTRYTIGYVSGTAGSREVWLPHPADASYTTELIYFRQSTNATSTDFADGLNEVEKMCVVSKASALIEGEVLKVSSCTGRPTCHCNACRANQWITNLKSRWDQERIREKPAWKIPSRHRNMYANYDVRGHQKIYNV